MPTKRFLTGVRAFFMEKAMTNNKHSIWETSVNLLNRFKKPSVEEIDDYAVEQGYEDFDSEYFYDYYESNGWIVGKVPMACWKASIRCWNRRVKQWQIEEN